MPTCFTANATVQRLVFFDELCGPTDFTQRNAQFVRVVPALVRLSLSEIVETVASLAALHVLSESLGSEMAAHLAAEAVSNNDYMRAWQAAARGADRAGQVALTLVVASRLDRFTRGLFVRNSLRLMRGPARAAGLSELQQFMETGFETLR